MFCYKVAYIANNLIAIPPDELITYTSRNKQTQTFKADFSKKFRFLVLSFSRTTFDRNKISEDDVKGVMQKQM